MRLPILQFTHLAAARRNVTKEKKSARALHSPLLTISAKRVNLAPEARGQDGHRRGRPFGSGEVAYETLSFPDMSIDVQTINDEMVGFGVMFYKRERLEDSELGYVYELLHSIDTQVKVTQRLKSI